MGRKCFCGSAGGAAPRGRPGPPRPLHPTPPWSSPSSGDPLPGYGLGCARRNLEAPIISFPRRHTTQGPAKARWKGIAPPSCRCIREGAPQILAFCGREAAVHRSQRGVPGNGNWLLQQERREDSPAQFSWPPSCIVPDLGKPYFSGPGLLQRDTQVPSTSFLAWVPAAWVTRHSCVLLSGCSPFLPTWCPQVLWGLDSYSGSIWGPAEPFRTWGPAAGAPGHPRVLPAVISLRVLPAQCSPCPLQPGFLQSGRPGSSMSSRSGPPHSP